MPGVVAGCLRNVGATRALRSRPRVPASRRLIRPSPAGSSRTISSSCLRASRRHGQDLAQAHPGRTVRIAVVLTSRRRSRKRARPWPAAPASRRRPRRCRPSPSSTATFPAPAAPASTARFTADSTARLGGAHDAAGATSPPGSRAELPDSATGRGGRRRDELRPHRAIQLAEATMAVAGSGSCPFTGSTGIGDGASRSDCARRPAGAPRCPAQRTPDGTNGARRGGTIGDRPDLGPATGRARPSEAAFGWVSDLDVDAVETGRPTRKLPDVREVFRGDAACTPSAQGRPIGRISEGDPVPDPDFSILTARRASRISNVVAGPAAGRPSQRFRDPTCAGPAIGGQ
jgi:hypothetical protein